MLPEFKSLKEQALTLPAEERERLASQLFSSLSTERLTDLDLKWLELAEKRFKALKSGEDAGINESDFFSALS